MDSYPIKAYFIHDLYLVHVVGAFTTLNQKAQYKYMSPLFSMQSIRIHLFVSIKFLYILGSLIS